MGFPISWVPDSRRACPDDAREIAEVGIRLLRDQNTAKKVSPPWKTTTKWLYTIGASGCNTDKISVMAMTPTPAPPEESTVETFLQDFSSLE